MRKLALHVFMLLLLVTPAVAVQPDEMLKDAGLEERARALSSQLRCMVCQNQSIDDSDAPLARDLRILVRERIAAGDDDKAVFDFLVARYGEFILLKPRLSGRTLFLWLAPAAALLIGAAIVVGLYRRRPARPAADLDPGESKRVEELLAKRE